MLKNNKVILQTKKFAFNKQTFVRLFFEDVI